MDKMKVIRHISLHFDSKHTVFVSEVGPSNLDKLDKIAKAYAGSIPVMFPSLFLSITPFFRDYFCFANPLPVFSVSKKARPEGPRQSYESQNHVITVWGLFFFCLNDISKSFLVQHPGFFFYIMFF
jgi:hypothetical protein